MNGTALVRTVFLTEARGLLRDRRALLTAVVLPMLLFPVTFYGMKALEKKSAASLEERTLGVAYDLTAVEPEFASEVLAQLSEPALRLELAPIDASALRAADDAAAGDEPESGAPRSPDAALARAARGLLGVETYLLVLGAPPVDDARPTLRLVYDGAQTLANEARERVAGQFAPLAEEGRMRALVALVGSDPSARLELEDVDVASEDDAAGHALGRLLPMILVLILVSGGSFAALGAFAGEREEGTIETLLVQPVSPTAVAVGKFLTVLATATIAALGNGASFLACMALGLGDPLAEASAGAGSLGVSAVRLGVGLLAFLPTAVLASAILCLISARAKSFREGQHYVLPLVLVGAMLASVSTQDRVPSSVLLSLVPVTGPTLVLRDTLAGHPPLVPALVAVVASLLWSALALRQLSTTLDAERLFRAEGGASEAGARRVQSRMALRWGLAAVAGIYVVGGRLQTMDPIVGLALTLWVVAPTIALLAARGTARRAGETLATTLGLGRPSLAHLVGALLLAPALVLATTALFAWQSSFLPIPSGAESEALTRAFEALPTIVLVLLVAVSPGLMEELLFRGALLSGMRRDLRPAAVVGWQALLFAAAHASIYRFLPTGLIGGILALVTLRARRVYPAMLAHAAYNAAIVLELPESELWRQHGTVLGIASGAIGVALLARTRAHDAGA